MIGASTERKIIRKKAFDNKYFGFKSSTANRIGGYYFKPGWISER